MMQSFKIPLIQERQLAEASSYIMHPLQRINWSTLV